MTVRRTRFSRTRAVRRRRPFTEKKELAAAQREGALIGPHLCSPRADLVRLVGTGGTSGKPLRIAWTRADVAAYNEMGARALWALGCRPGDLVVNCFNYSIYAGGVMDHMAFENLGATMLAYGVGKSRQLLDLLADLPGQKSLYATPSYAVRLAEVAREAGIDPWPGRPDRDPSTWRRSIYVFLKRSIRYPMFEAFDQPDMISSCERRNRSTVAPQALLLMNNAFINMQARFFAQRLQMEVGTDAEAQIGRAFELALARPPNAYEREKSLAFVNSDPYGLVDLCQTLFNLNEFAYLQ